MTDSAALKTAIELILMPMRARNLREAPLPDGIDTVLRIAAGDSDAGEAAALSADRPLAVVREAAGFFIEQLMLHPDADSYRILGATRTATAADLRHNMALLMRWLHPDANPSAGQAVYVNRVNRAWDDLKTPERRSAYDQRLSAKAHYNAPRSTHGTTRQDRARRHTSMSATFANSGRASAWQENTSPSAGARRHAPPSTLRLEVPPKQSNGLLRWLLGRLLPSNR